MEDGLTESVNQAVSHHINPGCHSDHNSAQVDVVAAVRNYTDKVQRDMERHSCEEALDYLLAMYKVSHLLTGRKAITNDGSSSKRRPMWQTSPLK
jgi:hypothetical protein